MLFIVVFIMTFKSTIAEKNIVLVMPFKVKTFSWVFYTQKFAQLKNPE